MHKVMETESKLKKEKKKYWYHTTRWVCVLCGYEEVYRYRCYDERPDDYFKRNKYRDTACDHHFM